jgi:hypothetical protein
MVRSLCATFYLTLIIVVKPSQAVYAVLATPLFLGDNVTNIDQQRLAIYTNPELLAINQDVDCIQGSLTQVGIIVHL